MEVLAVGSSIAGLLSLTGQCISGAQKLVGFYQDISKTSKAVEYFLKDINSLIRTLNDAQVLLQSIKEKSPHTFDDLVMTALKLQLEDCNDDLGSWLKTAQSYRPSAFYSGPSTTRTWFRKFWMAVNKDEVNNIRAEMQKRRNEIAVALTMLGR